MEHRPSGTADASRPLVVLVHGSLDRGASFARVVRRLGDLHVITYDRRGYHRSRGAASRRAAPLGLGGADSAPSDPFEQHVDDLLDLVGVGPSVIVGHSFGGDLALAAALRAPAAVRAVGAYEPPTPWLEWWPRRSRGDVTAEDPARHAEAFFRRVVSDEAWERLPARTRDERRADGPALVADLAALRDGRAPFDVTDLSVPVVLGRGERSLPHHRRAIDTLATLIPGAEVYEIPGATHGAHLSHPDAFAGLVRAAVERSGA